MRLKILVLAAITINTSKLLYSQTTEKVFLSGMKYLPLAPSLNNRMPWDQKVEEVSIVAIRAMKYIPLNPGSTSGQNKNHLNPYINLT